jgi:hypothetical protein
VNVLQSFQFFLNVTLIIVSNGQGLAQMAAGVGGTGFLCCKSRVVAVLSNAEKLMFVTVIGAEAIFMVMGFLLGQIRTLQRLSWLANLAIWLNVVVIIMTYVLINFDYLSWGRVLIRFSSMVVVNQYPPNYEASQNTFGTLPGPVKTSANWPEDTDLYDRINGLMNCVFAYGGATLFNELMAEMRRPYVET